MSRVPEAYRGMRYYDTVVLFALSTYAWFLMLMELKRYLDEHREDDDNQ